MTSRPAPEFRVLGGEAIEALLRGREEETIEVVQSAYAKHCTGATINPASQFLRFPDRPSDRIIALPAAIGDPVELAGIKWIASVPGNVGNGLPRASAVVVLNDMSTGYPFACLEGSIISATRTAAFAALAARELCRQRTAPRRLSLIGSGLIARYVETYLAAAGFQFDEITVHDLDVDSAEAFGEQVRQRRDVPVRISQSSAETVRAGDLVVLTTTASTPHLNEPADFAHGPLVLHVSLRDLGTRVVREAVNIVDDVDHCLTAHTSVHLVELESGSRGHVNGTLGDVMAGDVKIECGRTIIFSPFGLGVLDLAIANELHEQALEAGVGIVVPGFFHDLDRHAAPPVVVV